MKKNDWIITGSVALYTYLFYQQSAGINFMLFTIGAIALLIVKDQHIIKRLSWIAAAIGTILTAACIAYYGNTLSFIANIVSLSVLSALSINGKTSVIAGLLFALYSYLSSIVYMIIDWVERRQNAAGSKSGMRGTGKILLIIFVPLLIALLFFFMYRASNPMFEKLTVDILDFITWSWVRFTLGGLLLMYGFFYHRKLKLISDLDENAPDNLDPSTYSDEGTFKFLNIGNENLSGIILLSLLNLLLLSVNVIDVNYLYLDTVLPEDMTYSEFVHQGIGMLITSIIIAVVIILFYFKGALNFFRYNRALKILAYIWVAQNIFMILSTVFRNHLYIEEYSLTYKRIGVYVYLLLAVIGLVFTFVKIAGKKTNWFLARRTSWSFYVVLIISCAVNWNMLITDFNMQRAAGQDKKLDARYLATLSPSNTATLLNYAFEQRDSVKNYQWLYFEKRLHIKMYELLEHRQQADWQSWCYDKVDVAARIHGLEEEGKVTELNFSQGYLEILLPLKDFSKLEKLNMSKNRLIDLSELAYFPLLNVLDLSSNYLDTLDKLPELPELASFNLYTNNIIDLSPLERIPNLLELNLGNNNLKNIKTLPALNKLEKLNLSHNKVSDYSPLSKLASLKVLLLNNLFDFNKELTFDSIPEIPSLRELNLSGNRLSSYSANLFEKIKALDNIETLDLSSNNIGNLYVLTNYFEKARYYDNRISLTLIENTEPMFEKLTNLNLSNNSIAGLSPLSVYPRLKYLYLSGNKLKSIQEMAGLDQLEMLDLSSNEIKHIDALEKLQKLTVLNLANNRLRNIAALSGLAGLETLTLTGNMIENIQPLSKLSALQSLYLSDNRITDISSLSGLKNLLLLNLTGNDIEDFSVLYEMKQLKTLYIDVDEKQLEKLEEALPDTDINPYSNPYYDEYENEYWRED